MHSKHLLNSKNLKDGFYRQRTFKRSSINRINSGRLSFREDLQEFFFKKKPSEGMIYREDLSRPSIPGRSYSVKKKYS